MEVHQQTDGNLAVHSEVGQDLRVVRRKQCDDGFDLNKNGIANEDIRATAEREGLALVNDRNRDLPLEYRLARVRRTNTREGRVERGDAP